ncbi:MAG: DUF599 family protein [Pseudomonadota bacterium]
MPEDLTIDQAAAAAILLLCWVLYSPMLRLLGRQPINRQLEKARLRWIQSLSTRAALPFDAILLGHIVNSVTFFGSATLIVLAGLFSVFADLRAFHAAIQDLDVAGQGSFALFVWQFGLLALVIAISFFSFTYALRKMIYVVALVAALPGQAKAACDQDAMATHAATVLTEAVTTFNFAIRGYYYAIAALCLLFSPAASIAASIIATAILIYRQTRTKTSRAIQGYIDAIGAPAPAEPVADEGAAARARGDL